MRALIAGLFALVASVAWADVVTVSPSGTGSGNVVGTIQDGTVTVIECAVTPTAGCKVDVGHGLLVTMRATASDGSIFKGWNTTCAGTGACTFTVSSAKTVGARFEPSTYQLSVTTAGPGSGHVGVAWGGETRQDCTAGTCTTTPANGEVVTLTVGADPGFLFTGWSGTWCRGTTNPCRVTMDAAKSVVANFQPSTYPLTVKIAGSGHGSVAGGPVTTCSTWSTEGCQVDVAYGAVVTLTATQDTAESTASVFKGWEGATGCGTAKTCAVTMTQARAPLARFEPAIYQVTVAVEGTASGVVQDSLGLGFKCIRLPGFDPATATTCSLKVANGTKLTLSATKDAGATFWGWGIVCTGTGNCSFTVNSDKKVLAKFNVNPASPSRCAGVICRSTDRCLTPSSCDLATGLCVSGVPLSCDDGDGCTKDECDPAVGCLNLFTYGPSCNMTQPPDNVTLTDLSISGDDLHADQTVLVHVTLDAGTAREDYRAEFVLFPAADPADEAEALPAFPLGEATFAVLPAGRSTRSIELTIPAEIPPGDYQLIAHEIPVRVREQGAVVEPASSPTYHIGPSTRLPLLGLAGFEPDSKALAIDAAGTITDPTVHLDSPFSGTLDVTSRNQAALRVPVRAYLEWSGSRIQLAIWDAVQQRYVDTLVLATVEANVALSVSLELAMREEVAAAIRAGLRVNVPVSTRVVMTVNEDRSITEDSCPASGDAAALCVHELPAPAEVAVVGAPEQPALRALMAPMSALAGAAPRSAKPLTWYKEFSKAEGSASKFRAGVAFKASATLSGADTALYLPGGGFYAWADAGLPIRVFNSSEFKFVYAEAHALSPIGKSPASAGITVSLLGNVVWSKTYFAGFGTSMKPVFAPIVKQGPVYQAVFTVGPIPITVRAGARGEVGMDWYLQMVANESRASLDLGVVPYASIAGFGSAAVGVPGVGFGIELALKLVEPRFTASVGGALESLWDDNGPFLRGSLSETLTYTLTLMSGKVSLVAEYPTLKWCKKRIGFVKIKFPCGFKLSEASYAVLKTPGIKLGPNSLLSMRQDLFEVALPCTVTRTCASEGVQCGSIPNGCGGTLQCNCGPGFSCSANQCIPSCVRTTCDQLGAACGTPPDGCGGTLTCDPCPADYACVENQCVFQCGPGLTMCPGDGDYCADLSADPVNCGACGILCPGGTTCQGGVCECAPATCGTAGQCGTLDDGCGGTLNCVCDTGQMCLNGSCQPGDISYCGSGCGLVYTNYGYLNCGGCLGGYCDEGQCVNGCGGCGPGNQLYCSGNSDSACVACSPACSADQDCCSFGGTTGACVPKGTCHCTPDTTGGNPPPAGGGSGGTGGNPPPPGGTSGGSNPPPIVCVP